LFITGDHYDEIVADLLSPIRRQMGGVRPSAGAIWQERFRALKWSTPETIDWVITQVVNDQIESVLASE
jgi:hypothetical protein